MEFELLNFTSKFFESISTVIEVLGTFVIIFGGIYSIWRFFKASFNRDENGYTHFRRSLGKSILLGLEFLIAGDIIGTVTVTPDFKNLGALGLIVIIRTFLSFTLELEIHGRWPWQSKS